MEMKDCKARVEGFKATLASVREQMKAELKSGLGELFAQHPMLDKIAWNQYTPYFNDGDACTFSSEAQKYSDIVLSSGRADDTAEDKVIRTAVRDFLGCFDDEDYLHFFGDHVSVTVTRDGLEVHSYDHD